jgi:RNA polymerase sigma-70 factor, ECF subfamily
MDSSPVARPSGSSGSGPGDDLLQQTFLQLQDELYGTLYYLVGNAEDARDALQETFIKCWRHRHEVPGVQSLKAWLFRIALNTGRDVRGTAWRRHRRALGESEAVLESPGESHQDDVERREQLARVRQALTQLRPQEQEVFLLRENGQLTYEQIAEATHLPIGTIKTRMRLALRRLREALEGS